MIIIFTLKEAGEEERGEMRPAVAQYIIPVKHNPASHLQESWLVDRPALDWTGMEIERRETVIPCLRITLKGHPQCISIIKPTNYMETLAVPSLRLGRLRLGGFDIVPVATFPIVLSCVCVRLRRDGRRFWTSRWCLFCCGSQWRHNRPAWQHSW